MNWYPWLVLAHVLGAFTFVFAHGVSAHAAFRLRGERDRARVEALLDLSQRSLMLLYLGLLVLLVAGVAAGFAGNHWGSLWIWLAIGVLIVTLVVMWAVASPYYTGLREALGEPRGDDAAAIPADPMTPEQLAAQLRSARPIWLAVVGGVGLVVLIGLMVLKPA